MELVLTDDALDATAEEALRHKTGARGLRTVLEDCLLDVMYEIPSRGDVKKCVVDEDSIRGRPASAAADALRAGDRPLGRDEQRDGIGPVASSQSVSGRILR